MAILDDSGQKLGDSAVLRLETMQDRRNLTLRIDPGRDRPVRLLVSADLRSSTNDFGPPRAEVLWKDPGMATRRPGESVAIMLPTSAGFFEAFFGVLYAGGVPVPIYPPFRPAQLEPERWVSIGHQ